MQELRPDTEIRRHIVSDRNLAVLRKAVKLRGFGGGKRRSAKEAKVDFAVNRLLIKAAYGRHVFRGSVGRTLSAIAQERQSYKANPEKLKEVGAKLLEASKKLRWAVLELGNETFPGFTEEQNLDRHHYLGRRVDHLMSKGEFLATFGKWRPTGALNKTTTGGNKQK